MADKIRLLSDTIANQIAAGEVIQRPASVVKELLENAIDAGANHLKLVVKNAGKTLVQIIDNGCGMSDTDARMCFEKHATSKIQSADDLFNIRTMGFRGEALASVAAIAQVEMKTRQWNEALGTAIEIEGFKVVKQEACQTPEGTSIAVKNLFYNVPARRNFLKSDSVELKYIIEEFYRVSISNPKISFQFFNNDHEIFHFKSGNLKQRICAIFEEKMAAQIVPVEENTYALNVTGFVGKPAFAKKTRGEQFIFVNNRFVKSPYLHHAIMLAFDQMLPKDSFPFYVLFLEIDPTRIDINVHPQKYEVKFEDEKLAYTFVNLAVKHALGAFAVTPSLDFNQEDHLNRNKTFEQIPTWISGEKNQTFNPYKGETISSSKQERDNVKNWQSAFLNIPETPADSTFQTNTQEVLPLELPEKFAPSQLHRKYIITQIKSGLILIDQQSAHERILYEKNVALFGKNVAASQRSLFPQTFIFEPTQTHILLEILADINSLGFDVQEFGKNTFVVHALPADLQITNERSLFEELIEQFLQNARIHKLNKRENIAQSFARSASIKQGKLLSVEEMNTLIDQLFACENPYTSPDGKFTFVQLTLEELSKKFENR